jgi:hypothetical protein
LFSANTGIDLALRHILVCATYPTLCGAPHNVGKRKWEVLRHHVVLSNPFVRSAPSFRPGAFPLRGPLVGVDLSRADLGGKAVRDPLQKWRVHRSSRGYLIVEAVLVLSRRCSLDRYWMISSAVANSVSGMVRPSALAVFILMTSSTFTTCCTRPQGVAVRRMKPLRAIQVLFKQPNSITAHYTRFATNIIREMMSPLDHLPPAQEGETHGQAARRPPSPNFDTFLPDVI